jgi:thiosulfate/3-mercaptopyruvate sulfurtransferase
MAKSRRWRTFLALPVLAVAGGLALAVATRPTQGVSQGGYASPGILIQADELKALIDRGDASLRILDVRHKAKYYLGHIPGAVQVWRPDLEEKKGGMLSAAHLERLLGRLGVGSKNVLVLYSDQCDHTRLWWLLAHWGFPLEQMKLLDGGMEAWKARGYPTQLTSPRLPPVTFRLPAAPQRTLLAATLEEVRAAAGNPRQVVVDVRPLKEYQGHETKEGAARAGHIPGAVSVDWHDTRVAAGPERGCWKSAPELRKIYGAKGVTPDKDVYLYGHTAACASCGVASLYLAGYPPEKLHLYWGSWVEWSRTKEPVKAEPLPPRPPKAAKGK